MNKYFIAALFMLLTSCVIFTPPHRIKKNFKYCYDGKATGIDKLLKVNGYYIIKETRYPIQGKFQDTINMKDPNDFIGSSKYFMFYRDGSIVYGFFDDRDDNKEYFRRMKSNAKEKRIFEKNFYWGRYVIENDTIKLQYINHPAPLAATWSSWEKWFRIVNDTTLQFVYERSLDPVIEREFENYLKEEKIVRSYARFVPNDNKPDSVTWLKGKKWFYCKH